MKKWQCSVCGYIHEGNEPPQKCPVCGADKTKFVEMSVSDMEEGKAGNDQQADVVESKGILGVIRDKFAKLSLNNNLHPISVHSPNGIIPIAFIFFVLAVLFESRGLARASYYNLVAALISMPAVLYSGYISWKHKYNGAKTALFLLKMIAGVASTIILLVLVIWRTLQPDAFSEDFSVRGLFLFWLFILFFLVGLAGHLGGKLVFKK